MQIEVHDESAANYIGMHIIQIVPQEGHQANLRIFWNDGEGEVNVYCTHKLFMLMSSIKNFNPKIEV